MKEKVILFDGTGIDKFYDRATKEAPDWKIENGTVTVGHHDIVSKEEFGDQHLHVEFYLHVVPGSSGQMKGNSGVYVQGCYEIQVLVSYGNEPKPDECGGVYSIAAPLTIASLPAETWQTYDIILRTAKLNEDGSIKENAVITVILNGQVIHNNFVLPSNTPGGVYERVVERGPLLLQDHGCPVSFRNVWIQPLD